MTENLKIFALGGLDENGKSLYVINYNEQLYIFDAGLRYPEEKLLGIDIILPDYQYLLACKDQIRGVFLTHGHDENIGALPFILEEIPGLDVYATNFTLLSLKNAAKRLKKNILQTKLHPIGVNDDFVVNGMNFHTFAVTHSVPESCGFAMETFNGMIVYTGDFILDFAAKYPYNTSINRIVDLAKKPTLLLLGESYNASYQGFVSPNHNIFRRLNEITDEVKGKAIISIYGQTISQFEEILNVAKKTKRKINLYTNLAKETLKMLEENVEGFSFPHDLITTNLYERDTIILVSELGNKVFDELTFIAENQETTGLKISSEDAFIVCCPAHTGTELSFARILDKLYKTDAQVFNISKEYVSMHAGSEDLKAMLTIFKPKYYMPVRGYYNKLVENAKIALDIGYNHQSIFVYDNGMVVNIVDGNIGNANQLPEIIECNETMVDGIGIGDVGNVVISDRRKLQQDGVLVIGIAFSMSLRRFVAPPEIQYSGFKIHGNEDEFFDKVRTTFEDVVFEYIQKPGLIDFNELRTVAKEKLIEVLKKLIDTEPMVLPVVISV